MFLLKVRHYYCHYYYYITFNHILMFSGDTDNCRSSNLAQALKLSRVYSGGVRFRSRSGH